MNGAKTTRAATVQIAILVGIAVALLLRVPGSTTGTVLFVAAGVATGGAILVRSGHGKTGRSLAAVLVPIAAVLWGGALAVTGGWVVTTAIGPESSLPTMVRTAIESVPVGLSAGLAALGTVLTVEEGFGEQGISKLITTAMGTIVLTGAVFVLFLGTRSALVAGSTLPQFEAETFLRPWFAPQDRHTAALTFFGLLTAVFIASRLALGAVPFAELAARSYQDRIRTVVGYLRAWFGVLAIGGIGVAVGWLLVFEPSAGASGTVAMDLEALVGEPASQTVLAIMNSGPLRQLLVTALLGLSAVTMVFKGLESVTGSITDLFRWLLGPVIGTGVTVGMATLVATRIGTVRNQIPAGGEQFLDRALETFGPTGIALGVLLAATGLFVLALFGLMLAVGIRFVPTTAGGSSLAAAGVGLGGVTVAIAESAALPVFAFVAVSILVWSIGQRGVRTRAELGPRPPAALSGLHTLGTLVLASVGVPLALQLYALDLPTIASAEMAVWGLGAVVLGFFVLLVSIKG